MNADVTSTGSPPRMRGKGSITERAFIYLRITPAYAGKSAPSPQVQLLPWDHPRVCGEKLHQRFVVRIRVGSPPRMRGKVERLCQSDCRIGITPAYAGKRNAQRLGASGSRDHPRICGEKYFFVEDCLLADRITPAYAGKRLWCRGHGAPGQDYPRVCGEKRSRFKRRQDVKGSPPHMRGKGKSLCDDLQRVGITPAYAGKRRLRSRPGDGRKDHPRVCGEKRIFRFKLTPIVGSPPRMRGKGLSAFRRSHRKGITPAYAGKRHSAMHPETFCRDHPRVCGEKTKKIP